MQVAVLEVEVARWVGGLDSSFGVTGDSGAGGASGGAGGGGGQVGGVGLQLWCDR